MSSPPNKHSSAEYPHLTPLQKRQMVYSGGEGPSSQQHRPRSGDSLQKAMAMQQEPLRAKMIGAQPDGLRSNPTALPVFGSSATKNAREEQGTPPLRLSPDGRARRDKLAKEANARLRLSSSSAELEEAAYEPKNRNDTDVVAALNPKPVIASSSRVSDIEPPNSHPSRLHKRIRPDLRHGNGEK